MTPAQQLADEITHRAWSLHSLSLAFAEPTDPVAQSQIQRAATQMVAQMRQDEDDRLSAQTAIDIMATLWPHCDPADCGNGDWWTSPLGRLVAKAGGVDGSEAVTHSQAAAMLGCAKGSIGVMISRGHLDRHPDSGVLRSSIMARLAASA